MALSEKQRTTYFLICVPWVQPQASLGIKYTFGESSQIFFQSFLPWVPSTLRQFLSLFHSISAFQNVSVSHPLTALLDSEAIMGSGLCNQVILSIPANTLILIENFEDSVSFQRPVEGKDFKASRSFLCCFIVPVLAAYFHLRITLALVAHTEIFLRPYNKSVVCIVPLMSGTISEHSIIPSHGVFLFSEV